MKGRGGCFGFMDSNTQWAGHLCSVGRPQLLSTYLYTCATALCVITVIDPTS